MYSIISDFHIPPDSLPDPFHRAEPAPAQAAFDIFSEPLITDLPEYPIAKAKARHARPIFDISAP